MTNQPQGRALLEFGETIAIERLADELTVIHELLSLDGKDLLVADVWFKQRRQAAVAAASR